MQGHRIMFSEGFWGESTTSSSAPIDSNIHYFHIPFSQGLYLTMEDDEELLDFSEDTTIVKSIWTSPPVRSNQRLLFTPLQDGTLKVIDLITNDFDGFQNPTWASPIFFPLNIFKRYHFNCPYQPIILFPWEACHFSSQGFILCTSRRLVCSKTL